MLAGGIALVLYLRSPQFNDLVRQKVVASIEDVTGGRVDLGAFHWNLSRLDFEATNLTVHGLEPSTAPPLAQVQTVRVRAHVVSLLQKRVDLTYFELDRPQIHLIVAPDGKTNLPEPRTKSASDPVQQLFDLAIGRAELRNGQLHINDRQLPLDFSANDLTAALTFDRRDRRYDGTLAFGKINAKYQDYRDLPLAAQAEFSVWPTRAQIKQLTLHSQNSHAEFSGTINNFSNPETRFDYSATIDLPQAAAIARVSGIRKGTATLAGNGRYDSKQYSASGKLLASSIDYDSGSQLRNASFRADFQADNAAIKLNNMTGHLLGGELTGKAEVSNSAPQPGQAELKLAGLSLAEVSRLISTRTMPLDKLKLAGALDGGVNLKWKGAPGRGLAEFDLRVRAPNQAASDQLAISGIVRGSYDLNSGSIELRPLQLSTAATQIDASGRIGSRSSSLNTSLQTSNLGEIDDVLNALGHPAVPLELAGQGSFQGIVAGDLRSPEIAGHLQASQFSYFYTPAQLPNAAPSQVRPIHVDSLQRRRFVFPVEGGAESCDRPYRCHEREHGWLRST